MSDHDYEAETRFLWEWAANSSALRMPDPLPTMTYDADDLSLVWRGPDMTVRFHVEILMRGGRRTQIAVIRANGKEGWHLKEERHVPEVVTQAARKAAA